KNKRTLVNFHNVMNKPQTFLYGVDRLDISTTIALSQNTIRGILDEAARKKINESQEHVAKMVAQDATVYGVTTGFGILANTKISKEDTALLQYKILQSHSVGVGAAIPNGIARLMLVTKVHALAQGFSG